MKKLLVLLVTVVAAVFVTATVAVADPGNGVATVQFTAAYDLFGNPAPPATAVVTCKGQRIVTSGANASVRDRQTCEVAGQFLPEGKYEVVHPSVDGCTNTFCWYSDYEYFVNPGGVVRWAVSGTVHVKNRPDGTSVWQVHVTY